METVERFRKAYDYLYESGAIHTKKDLAEKMKVSRGSVQYAYVFGETGGFGGSFFLRPYRDRDNHQ